jgi:hypothetical protein
MLDDEICYLHKIAYTKIIEEEPIPFMGVTRFITYECPMCEMRIDKGELVDVTDS